MPASLEVKFKFAVVPATELAETLVREGAPASIVTWSVGVAVFPYVSVVEDPVKVTTPLDPNEKLQPEVQGLVLPLVPLNVYEIPPLLEVTRSDVALVKLSVDEVPRSSAGFKVSVTVGVIAVFSILTLVKFDESEDVTPLNVCDALNEYVSLASEEKVQLPEPLVAVKVQITGEPAAGVAVTVTTAPVVKPVKSIVGVSSAV